MQEWEARGAPCADDKQEVASRQVIVKRGVKRVGELLSEEDDVRLDHSTARCTPLRYTCHCASQEVVRRCGALAVYAGGSVEGAVAMDDCVRGKAGHMLKAVNVLRIHAS